jgi:hypothetical protein
MHLLLRLQLWVLGATEFCTSTSMPTISCIVLLRLPYPWHIIPSYKTE